MIKKLMIAMLGVLTVARVAGATTIDTAPLQLSGTLIFCSVLNNSDKTISLNSLVFFDQDGVSHSLILSPSSIDAHQAITFGSNSLSNHEGFCRAEGAFSKTAVKVTLCTTDPASGNICSRAVSN
jgi:hypothetical protein